MDGKVKLTRPELKRQKDVLSRYKRYLPTLKLKQQLLQAGVLTAVKKLEKANAAVEKMSKRIESYEGLFRDIPGVPVEYLSKPVEIEKKMTNVAGVNIPVFVDAKFPTDFYSLFSTPPWVDRAIDDLRDLNRLRAKADLVSIEVDLLQKELTKIVQRINLFEKIMIPRSKNAIRKISIYLADEQTAGVVRAKIAKAKQKEKALRQRESALKEEIAP